MHHNLPKHRRLLSRSRLGLFSSPSVEKLPCSGEEAVTKAVWLVGTLWKGQPKLSEQGAEGWLCGCPSHTFAVGGLVLPS